MSLIHGNLPSIATAKLPAAYENAKSALATCTQLDECKDWADKAAALASYARQSDDDSLQKMAERVRARAIRRCGELLREIKPARGANQNIRGDAPPKVVTRTDAAHGAGMSDDQRKTALRVAAIPESEFEAAVESDDPPTVTELAEQGKTRPAVLDVEPAPPPKISELEAMAAGCVEHADELRRYRTQRVAVVVLPTPAEVGR